MAITWHRLPFVCDECGTPTESLNQISRSEDGEWLAFRGRCMHCGAIVGIAMSFKKVVDTCGELNVTSKGLSPPGKTPIVH